MLQSLFCHHLWKEKVRKGNCGYLFTFLRNLTNVTCNIYVHTHQCTYKLQKNKTEPNLKIFKIRQLAFREGNIKVRFAKAFQLLIDTVNVDIFMCINYSGTFENWQFRVYLRFQHIWLFRLS